MKINLKFLNKLEKDINFKNDACGIICTKLVHNEDNIICSLFNKTLNKEYLLCPYFSEIARCKECLESFCD